jgi:PAS domain S-box-containing protein
MSTSIRTRLSAAFLLLAALPLLVAAVFGLNLLYRYALTISTHHMEEIAQRVASQVEHELTGYEHELRMLLRYQDFTRLPPAEQRRLLEELLAANDYFVQGMLLDSDGRELARVSSRDFIAPDALQDRRTELRFTRPLTDRDLYVSDVFIDDVYGEPLVSISVPILDLHSGRAALILSVDARLANIWHFIAGLKFETGVEVYVLDQNNRLVAHRNPSLVLRDTRFNYQPTSRLQRGLAGTQVVLADTAFSFGRQQFLVVAEQTAGEALRPAWDMLAVFAAVSLLALAAAIVLVGVARRMIVDRLIRVAETARAIAGGDLQRRMVIERDDELGMLGVAFNDMTEHLLHSLEQAHLSEEQFRQLAETVPQVVWLADWSGVVPPDWSRYRLIYVSPLFEQVWGRRVSELHERPELWNEGIHPEDRQRVRQTLQEQAAATGFVCEYRVVRPDGSVRHVRDQALPVHDAAGQVYRLAGLAQDVTELRDNERRLTRLNRALQTLSACNEALVRAADEEQLLQSICQHLVTRGKYLYAIVQRVDRDGLPRQQAIDCGMAWDDVSPAVREAIGAVQRQVLRQPQAVSLPLAVGADVGLVQPMVTGLALTTADALQGTLVVWGSDAVDQDEIRLLRELADDVAFGLQTLRIRQERDRAEQQIILERDRAEQYLQIAAVMIVALNERGQVVLLNRKGCELLGYTEEEVLGRDWFDTFVPEEMRAVVRDTFAQLMAGSIELTEHYDNPVLTRSGERRLISFSNNFVRDAAGRIIGTISSGEDITEWAHNQEQLARLTRALRTLSACNEALVRTADEQELLQRICDLIVDTGSYRRAWIGYAEPADGFRIVARAARDAAALAAIDTIVAAGAGQQRDAMARRGYVRCGGTEAMAGSPDAGGSAIALALIADHAVLGTLSVYSDAEAAFDAEEVALLTELAADLAFGIQVLRIRSARDLAEQSLRELNAELEQRVEQRTRELQRNEERFRITVASLAEGVVVTDTAGRVQFMNPEAEHLLGWPQQELAGANLHDAVHVHAAGGAQIPFADCPQHHAIASGRIFQSDGETFRRRDGGLFPAAVVAAPLKAEDRVIGTVVAFQDISLRKEVERMKDELISTVSHELRTPLTSLRGFVELMLMRDYPRERQQEFLQIVHRETLRLNKLVDEFLDIQRMESGRQEYLMKPLALVPLLEDIVARYRQTDTLHVYHLELAAELPLVVGDVERLQQVMENLLSNAVKFSPDGGAILVSAQRHPDTVEVRVQDHGIGIPAEALGHVFEKFYRVEQPADRPRAPGTGLGLPLVQEIIAAHGGVVGAESTFGEGSSFWFTLPLPHAS